MADDREDLYRRYRDVAPIWAETKRLLKVSRDKDVLPAMERLVEEHRRLTSQVRNG